MANWIGQPNSRTLLNVLRAKNIPHPQKIQRMLQLGYPNMGQHSNYIFHISDCGVVGKIPVTSTMFINYIVMRGLLQQLNENKLTRGQIAKLQQAFLNNNIETKQGISQVDTTRKLLEAAKNNVYDSKVIQFRPSYIYPYPGIGANTAISDPYYFVLQNFEPQLKKVNVADLSINQLQELVKAAWAGRLWDYPGQIYELPNKALTITDLEKPDRLVDIDSDGADIYAINALKKLVDSLPKNSDKQTQLIEFLEKYFTRDKFRQGANNSYQYFQNNIIKPYQNHPK